MSCRCCKKNVIINAEKLCTKCAKIVNGYYKNEGRKLRFMVDLIVKRLNFHSIDLEEFYSLADVVFIGAIDSYDPTQQSFHGFLYSCLENKFKTRMTFENRYKRQNVFKVEKRDERGNIIIGEDGEPEMEEINVPDISTSAPLSNEEGSSTVEDILGGKRTVENQIYGEKKIGFSQGMMIYLSRLSDLQKKVLYLVSLKYTSSEIMQELHIDEKIYKDCRDTICACRNTQYLMNDKK